MNEPDFGARISRLRIGRRLTLEQLAEAAGTSKSYLWELENRSPPRPSAQKLAGIAAALGVTVDYLYGRDEQSLGDAEDRAFFQEYAALPAGVRRQVREITRILARGQR